LSSEKAKDSLENLMTTFKPAFSDHNQKAKHALISCPQAIVLAFQTLFFFHVMQ
jgi:hypothetical protein